MSSAPSTSSSDPARGGRGGARPLLRWIPVVVWAGFISWFSTGAFSAHSTHHYIDPVLRLLFGDLTPEGFRLAHAVVRKTAHFVEYAVLAVLLARALVEPRAPIAARTVVRTVVLCALYAAADELHQVFVPSRGGSATDVALDTVGAVCGALLVSRVRAARVAGTGRPAALSARSRGRASAT